MHHMSEVSLAYAPSHCFLAM